ncbi:hypothetical protein HYU11_06345 [Candidatus Woesearchaeota archaeon]|nr:hypothetical protein [Candidatus Woesearchaeota archaeon]
MRLGNVVGNKLGFILLLLAALVIMPFAYAHLSNSFVSGQEIDKSQLRAVTVDDQTQVEIKRKLQFMSEADTPNELAEEIISRLEMDESEIDEVLDVMNVSNKTLLPDKFRLNVRIDDSMVKVRLERRITLDTTSRDDIIESIKAELGMIDQEVRDAVGNALEDEALLDEERFEKRIRIRNGEFRLEVRDERDNDEFRFELREERRKEQHGGSGRH